MELVGEFSEFIASLQPGDNDVTAAKEAHEKVRDQLRTDSQSKEAHKDTFLTGSYARHTAINDINDVDVIFVLDIDHTITTPPAHGTATVEPTNGSITYQPTTGYSGTDSLQYTVCDDLGAQSNTASISVRIQPAPVAANDTAPP